MFGYFWWGNATGQTLGRRLLKVAVVRRDHPDIAQLPVGAAVPSSVAADNQPGWGSGVLRTLTGAILGLIYFLPYLWALFDNDNRTLGDIFAKTIVVGVETPQGATGSLGCDT